MLYRTINFGSFGLALCLWAAGCGSGVVKRVCTGSGSSALVGDAALIRLDVYGANAHCANNVLLPGAGAPIVSHSYAKGQAIKLDVPPGPHAIVLTTFSDAAATMALGEACTEATLAAGSQICFDLTLVVPPDGGTPDLSACGPSNPSCQCANDADCMTPTPRCAPSGMCVACLPQNDNCSFDHYCDPSSDTCLSGCKSNAECASIAADGGVPVDTLCDPTRHTCVQCLGNGDCPSGQLCSRAGTCVAGCDPQAGKLCPGSLTCCNKVCVDTTSDPFNCNGCGNICNGGNTICCGSVCKNPNTDPDNCNGCGKVCSNNHMATRTCGGGTCNGTCATNFGDCNNNKLIDGCEVDLTSTTANCGSCGNDCGNGQVQHATGAYCNNKSCDYVSCNPSTTYGDCNGNRADGCETNITSSTGNCGSCGYDCTAHESCVNGAFCNNKVCDYVTCGANCKDCNGIRSDGCEINTNTSTGNCGSCGYDCVAHEFNVTGPFCNAGSCDYAACSASNFKDCNGVRSDGCEVNINTDPSHCGSCTRPCSTNNVTGGTTNLHCTGGLCDTTSCNAPFNNCTQPSAPAPDDGCEQNIHDVNHCGNCTNMCTVNNDTPACPSGTCTIASCNPNFYDCNGSAGDGCECPGPGSAPGCCTGTNPTTSGTCQTKHRNGTITPSVLYYWDCYGLGSPGSSGPPIVAGSGYNSTMSIDAATVDPQPGGLLTGWLCDESSGNGVDMTCKSQDSTGNTGSCTCWVFGFHGSPSTTYKSRIGHMYANPGTGPPSQQGCANSCPLNTDPTWN